MCTSPKPHYYIILLMLLVKLYFFFEFKGIKTDLRVVPWHPSASSAHVPLGPRAPYLGEEGKRMTFGLTCVNVALYPFRHIRL